MKKVVVLGAGMVGSAIALDLCKRFNVVAVDLNEERLKGMRGNCPVETIEAEIHDPEKIRELVSDCDLVVGALPGFMGFNTLWPIVDAGKDVIDISFFNEDPFELDDFAKEKDVTVLMDCGVAPGMSNIILGYHNARMEIESYECYVGGMPFERKWPYYYKAPFSPSDVIEEYIRPARMVVDGKIVVKPALSDPEFIDIDPIGSLEAFNTDGLRTLLKTVRIPQMKEKTLRYPGHRSVIEILKATGFFGREPVSVGGQVLVPLQLTEHLLFPKWYLKKDEPEFTVMKIVITGTENGRRKQYNYHLFDHFDKKTMTSSMARTTGYTCTAVVDLFLEGKFKQKGVCPPEYIGADQACFDHVLTYLAARGVHYQVEEMLLPEEP